MAVHRGGRETDTDGLLTTLSICNTQYHISLVEPLIPLTEIDELVFYAIDAILIEDLVDSSSKSLGVCVR